MSTQPGQPRVRVTSSRRGAPHPTNRPVAEDVSEQTHLGEVYVAGLMRAQLRLAASVLVVGALVLGALPLVLTLWPQTRAYRIGPLPLPWLVLGVLVYPAAVAAAHFYVRSSENLEKAFVDVVNRS
ncbi:MAG: hypothetical protein V9G19_00825 [Tetrasphaera sp.]